MKNVLRVGLRLLIVVVCAIVGAYLLGTNMGALLSDIRPSDNPVDKTQVLIHLGLALLGGFLLSVGGVGVSRGYISRGSISRGSITGVPLDLNSRHFAGFVNLLYFRQVADRKPLIDEPPDYPQGMDTTIAND